MTPFFFGNSAEPLYGVYHPPTSARKTEGVLLCPPFGQEYMRSHRAFRQLAYLLNKLGYPVLRFDYKGTGDSFGNPDDTSIENWIDNIVSASEELIASSNVESISLIGLRLGGLLATYACTRLDNAKTLVLWDSVVSGNCYISELKDQIAASSEHDSNFVDESGNLHFNGFPILKKHIEALEHLDLLSLTPNAKRVIQITSSENTFQTELKEHWNSLPNATYQCVPAPGDWNYVDDFGGILLPQQVIQAIVECFSQAEGDK